MSKINQKTTVNGQAFSFVDIKVTIAELPFAAFNGIPIKSISYNQSRQRVYNYENSKYPTSFSIGKATFTGSVTFTMDSFELLRAGITASTAGYTSITELPPINILIKYNNAGKSAATEIKGVLFTSENVSGSEGDDTFSISCDFVASDIFNGLEVTKAFTIATINLDNQDF